ncbi:MAG: DUF2339 domain-containing protein [Verrucomicrobiales bacterium]|jgi:uncharacterized membrane protein|nr:DUF2339 domain-containing protein [Verrucomicrobiales bacterium]
MECPKCTADNDDEASQCRLCGFALKQPPTPPPMEDSRDTLRHAISGLREQIDAARGVMFASLGKLGDALAEVEKNLSVPLTVSLPAPAVPAAPKKVEARQLDRMRFGVEPAVAEKIEPASPPLVVEVPQKSPPAPLPPPLPPVAPPAQAQTHQHQTGASELHIGQKWLLFAGITITVLGVGYLLNLAFQENWISPVGRVIMAYLFGGAFMGAGEWFRRKGGNLLRFGLPLIGCGVVILYFSSFAAYQIYGLIGQGTAFGLMALITAFTGILSLKYDSRALAVVGLVGGFITPLLLGTGTNNYLTLFTYLTILNLGVAWLSFHKRWSLLNILGFVFTWLLFSGWFFRWYADSMFWPAIIFLNVFFAIYALVPYAYYFRHQARAQTGGLSLGIANSFIAFGYAFGMIKGHTDYPAASIISLLYAGVFFAMARHLHLRQPENQRSLVMTLAMGLLFLTITVPILFSGHWLTIFWMAEGAIVLWAALRLDSAKLRWTAMLLLAVVFGKFILRDYPLTFGFHLELFRYRPHYGFLWAGRHFTTLVSLGALYAAGRLLWKNHADAGRAFFITFGLALFALLTAEVSGFFADFNPNARAAAVSVLWSLYSIGLMVIGFGKRITACRFTAIGLFAVTVLKVLLSDMAHVSVPFRVLSCVILGILLIGASYLYYRYSEVLMPEEPKKTEDKQS